MITRAGAPSAWDNIDWKSIEAGVHRLQMRIAKAIRQKRYGKAKALQWLLTHSSSAKLLAIKRITSSQGSKTPGVDKVTWSTSDTKLMAVNLLKRRGYKAQPLRRIYITKANGKKRPLGIPTMVDRAQQTLYLLSLDPIVETVADTHAYGFRKQRCTADAIEQCMRSLWQKGSAEWILEGDIQSAFDNISHDWLLENIPVDKVMLKQWLNSGYISEASFNPTVSGTPQGGIISPALLVLTLSGLERAILASSINKRRDKVHVVTYADDFVVTGATKEVLIQIVKPTIEKFLSVRGLSLSPEKTKITHVSKGFDFLGFTVRKFDKMISRPSKVSIKRFLLGLRQTVKANKTAKTENLIRILNPKLLGWGNYFRGSAAAKIFAKIEHEMFGILWRWIHTRKSAKWRKKRYFRTASMENWVFFAKTVNNKTGKAEYLDLVRMSKISIRRHIKIIGTANPYDPNYGKYFKLCKEDPKRGKAFILNNMPYHQFDASFGHSYGCGKA